MKIFVAFLLTLVTLASADVSGYNYYAQQQQQQQLYQAPQQQQSLLAQVLARLPPQETHALPGSISNPMRITQPSFQYIAVPQQKQQQQQPILHQILPVQQQHIKPHLPMPASYPAQHTAVRVVKQRRRLRPRVKIPKKPIVTKNFFIHSAPEESEEELQEELSQLAEQPRKHYNVLFVKTPTQTNKAAAVNLAKTLKEEKTVVYVLSKKTSAADLQDALQEAPQQINKPDVFFIKYRTPEEAEHAQREIQSQYDTLGGSTTITDEGVAPITSVVGSLEEPEYDEDSEEEEEQLAQQQQTSNQDQFPIDVNALASGQYLPAANKL